MITLTLLHPIQSIPVQSWNFEHESLVRIGRSMDNHVILYSAVVSRHHVELRRTDSHWEIVNLGANGTYLEGKRISQVPVQDGVIIRLARSGPNLQIHLGKSAQKLAGETTISQRTQQQPIAAERQEASDHAQSGASPNSPSLPLSDLPKTDFDSQQPGALFSKSTTTGEQRTSTTRGEITCSHPRAKPGMVFCIDCGEPLQILQTIGEYQIIKTLSQDETGVTFLGFRHDQRLLLKTLSSECVSQPEAIAQFQEQATQLLQFDHPGLPRFVDFFMEAEQPYLAMEPVHGQDLEQWVLKRGVFADADAIAIVLQVCDVLNYLHQQSPPFLHLDLTPANLVQQFPPVPTKITVAGFLSLPLFKVNTSTSSSYVAPEQIQGHPVLESDLFALGPILVYLLTGKNPSSFYAQREQGFRLYPEYIPGLNPNLVTVIRRLTNPDATERYGSAQEVAEALLQVS